MPSHSIHAEQVPFDSRATRATALLIGSPACCRRLERQLALVDEPPVVIGWVVTEFPLVEGTAGNDAPILGHADALESLIARRRPALAIISLPAAMNEKILHLRTRLRRLGVPDRFMPTLEDQLAGVGPRTERIIDPGQLLDRPQRRIDDDSIARLLTDRVVLITGAGGSIGAELCRVAARYRPARLVMVERSENALFEIDRQIARFFPDLPRKALLHDVVEHDATREQFAAIEPEIIFHAAAHKHVPMMEDHPAAAIENNVFGTRSVLDAAVAVGAERFVMISSDKAVNPSSIMGATKRLAEMYVQSVNRQRDTACGMVRFGNVLGSAGSVLEVWSRQIREGGPLTITDPRMTRYFMTIPEAASLVIQSAALMTPGRREDEVFLLDMGDPVSILDLAKRFCRLHGLEPIVVDSTSADETTAADAPHARNTAEIRIVTTGARPGEKLFEELARDVEALKPTRHPDIHIWSLPEPGAAEMQRIMHTLDRARREKNPSQVARAIRSLVPEMVQPAAA